MSLPVLYTEADILNHAELESQGSLVNLILEGCCISYVASYIIIQNANNL